MLYIHLPYSLMLSVFFLSACGVVDSEERARSLEPASSRSECLDVSISDLPVKPNQLAAEILRVSRYSQEEYVIERICKYAGVGYLVSTRLKGERGPKLNGDPLFVVNSDGSIRQVLQE